MDLFNATADLASTNLTQDPEYCPKASKEELINLLGLSFILDGVVKMIVCVMGVMGNTISITLLLSAQLRNSFNKLLAILAVFDLIYLFTMTLDSLDNLGLETSLQTLMFPYFLYPLNSISLMCSIYMTLIVALERYMAVYNPLDYNRRQQDSTSQRYHLINYVGPLIILAFLFNLTRFLESKVIYYSVGNDTKVDIDITALRMDQLYVTYYINWAQLLVLGIFPFIAITFLNTKIYLAIRRRRKRRRVREDSMSIVLMIIVTVFILSNIPRLVLNMHELTVIEQVNSCKDTDLGGFPSWVITLGFVSHVLLALNSSANILIYCLVGNKFRKAFIKMVGCGEAPVHCRCVQLTESSLCPLCGRSIRGLRTRQGSILTRSREVESDLLCYQVRILSLGCRQRSGGDPSQSDKQDDRAGEGDVTLRTRHVSLSATVHSSSKKDSAEEREPREAVTK